MLCKADNELTGIEIDVSEDIEMSNFEDNECKRDEELIGISGKF